MSTLLGLDVGERRIGVAVGESRTGLVRPLTTLRRAHPRHDADSLRVLARDHKKAFAARLAAAAREASASDPEGLGEQLALLLDGASARGRVLDADAFATAAAIAVVLIDNALPLAVR